MFVVHVACSFHTHIYRVGDMPMTGADPGVKIGGGHMAKTEPITGVWGLCPQWGPGSEPLVRGLRGEAP